MILFVSSLKIFSLKIYATKYLGVKFIYCPFWPESLNNFNCTFYAVLEFEISWSLDLNSTWYCTSWKQLISMPNPSFVNLLWLCVKCLISNNSAPPFFNPKLILDSRIEYFYYHLSQLILINYKCSFFFHEFSHLSSFSYIIYFFDKFNDLEILLHLKME